MSIRQAALQKVNAVGGAAVSSLVPSKPRQPGYAGRGGANSTLIWRNPGPATE